MKYTIFAAILIFLATIKVIATLAGWDKVVALASMTNLSPAMKVFTAHKGYETYSGSFEIEADFQDGKTERKVIDSPTYAHLKGPYNRRNVYGALIAYGPLLVHNPKTKPMYDAMTQYAFCQESHILKELAFSNPSALQKVQIHYDNTNISYSKNIEVRCE